MTDYMFSEFLITELYCEIWYLYLSVHLNQQAIQYIEVMYTKDNLARPIYPTVSFLRVFLQNFRPLNASSGIFDVTCEKHVTVAQIRDKSQLLFEANFHSLDMILNR